MEFWITRRNNQERIRLPVLPSSYEVEVNHINKKLNIHELGAVNFIGKSDLRHMTIESFFPARYYSFCEFEDIPNPWDIVVRLERWRKSGEPVRVIVTETNINIPFAIESFIYGERDGTGDIYYTLDLSEYVFMNVKKTNDESGYSQSGERPVFRDIQEKYTVQVGDTLGLIAKKLTGNFDNYVHIAARNGITDVNNITPGMELFIW